LSGAYEVLFFGGNYARLDKLGGVKTLTQSAFSVENKEKKLD
jgi:hypothetical protein